MPNSIVRVVSLFVLALMFVIAASCGRNTTGGITMTRGAVRLVESGVERFVLTFPVRRYAVGDENGQNITLRGYPNRDREPVSADGKTDGEWLRLLLAPTDEELAGPFAGTGVTHAALSAGDIGPYLNSEPITIDGRQILAGSCIVDGWNQPLRYRFPGSDHSAEVTFDGVYGRNHLQLAKPDVWSIGENGEDYYAITPDTPTLNDPGKPDAGLNDDLCNWFDRDR